ncbi:MAG: DUF1853 family protein [Burkholderiales bacterium]|nr:DUF1853 family protein [Burkholderiales bacterium]
MPTQQPENYQGQFERRWPHLHDPHVRDLAWLLDSPDLLDPAAPQWQGKLASFRKPLSDATVKWLHELDASPTELSKALNIQALTRLGRYAERLMTFYFRQHGMLVAQGVQVRAGKGETIGEFDFLLREGEALVHWELATKLYLLEPSGTGLHADYFVGPNLADTLGTKMRKIFSRQLNLAEHPAAQPHLPAPIARAQALIKGWLFYEFGSEASASVPGVTKNHCRGFWCELQHARSLPLQLGAVLPRLRWLAPAKMGLKEALDKNALLAALQAHFAGEHTPVLIALLEQRGDVAVEVERGFIVPDDWRQRASRLGPLLR